MTFQAWLPMLGPPPMNVLEKCLPRAVVALLRILLGFYFRRIEVFRPERVPLSGPVLFVSNHPGSVTDAILIGTSVQRQVHFVATVRLFGFKPLAWLLKQCGVIPINRVKDDPRAMRTVAETFESCFKVLERGGAVGIFPEGITYDDSQLKQVKTGAARMALEFQHRHAMTLNLAILPVGLTYSAKERYRSEVLVHFGEPIHADDFLKGYADRRKESINRLSGEIEQRLKALILHLPDLECGRVVEAVKRLYLHRLRIASRVVQAPVSPGAETLLLGRAIADAVTYFGQKSPDRLAGFTRKLDRYERLLKRLRLSDESVARVEHGQNLVRRSVALSFLALVGFPIALYGWVHRLLPASFVNWIATRFTDAETRKAQTAHASMLAGLVAFTVCYALYVALVHHWFGWPVSLWYALSLPVAGLLAHYYMRELGRLADAVRTLWILVRAPLAAKHAVKLRSELVKEIEIERQAYRRALDNVVDDSTT